MSTTMQAACYDRTGPARDVLQLGELPLPEPGPGERRVRLAWCRAFGTAAQCVVLPQRQAVALRDEVPDDAAARFGIPALTALHTMLVDGGAGAVGHYGVKPQASARLGMDMPGMPGQGAEREPEKKDSGSRSA